MPSPAAASPRPTSPRASLLLTLLIAGILLLNFLSRLPTWQVADWGQFAFYDPGTVLKGDQLLSKGYIPTVDFGYTHGLLSLLYGRVGFALLGRTANTFLLLTLLTEWIMANALARILLACRATRAAIALFCFALPMAIMPAYLTLTHPLEAMLLLLALAAHAEGKRSQALALLTACLFVKPSMAYVYGLVMLLLILWHHRHAPRTLIRQLVPAIITLLVMGVALSLWMGPGPVLHTLLPTTGAKTYAATGFGFFAASGRAFWWPPTWAEQFFTPAAAFLLATAATLAGALFASARLLRTRTGPATDTRLELLLALGLLQSAFLLGFYGWTGSWTYYSYLPTLGLTITFTLLPLPTPQPARQILAAPLALLLLLSHDRLAGDIYNGWHFKTRNAATANLWADPDEFTQFEEALQATHDQPTLLMTNGYLANLPRTITLPDAWFPEPGIPTRSEIARVKSQTASTTCIILWWEYRQFDLWNSPEFSDTRDNFHAIFKNERFTVLQKNE